MKFVLRIFLPALIPFPVMAWLGKLLISFDGNAMALSEITFSSLKIFLSVAMPLLVIVALLVQALIIVQLQDAIQEQHIHKRLVLAIVGVALLLSYLVAYVLWQPSFGVLRLLRSVGVMLTVQAVYWLLNVATLYLVHRIYKQYTVKAE
jgi:type IV secretory pathway TrbL component